MTRTLIRFLPGSLVAACVAIAVTAATPLRAQGQAAEPLPRFEVASVKENTSGSDRAQMALRPGGRFVTTNAPLKRLIADAFVGTDPLATSRVLGGPEWVGSARYDINAKASMEFQPSAGGPPQDMLLMLRSLLEDRFRLRAHHEMREMPVYELVVARADGQVGPQLHASTVDCDALAVAIRGGAPPPTRQPNEPPPCGAMRGPARILAGGIPMPQFAAMLAVTMADANGPAGRDFARVVIDKTGLTGRFAFTLAWTPEQMPTTAPPPGIPPIDPNGPSFFTALQEQLGLKLVPTKAPVDVLVIDSAERPTND